MAGAQLHRKYNYEKLKPGMINLTIAVRSLIKVDVSLQALPVSAVMCTGT